MIAVFDSSALLAVLRAEAGLEAALDVLTDPANSCHVHAVNLCEVFYNLVREYDEEWAVAQIAPLQRAGLVCHTESDAAMWMDAGRLKAEHVRVSLADCFGMALTRTLHGVFLTSDHHELDALKQLGVCDIEFIR